MDYDEFIRRDQRTTPRTKRRHAAYWSLFIIAVTAFFLYLLISNAN